MYIIFYTLNLFIFYLIIFLTTPLILLWRTPINVYLIFLKKYNKFYNLILLLLFNLTGLPPTVFFFIKVNLLFDLVYRLNFFNILFLFFVFFSSAIYYLQPLYNKNSDYDLTSYLNKYIFCSKNVAFTNYFFYKTSWNLFNVIYFTIIFLFFSYFSVFFFFDFYCIVKSFS